MFVLRRRELGVAADVTADTISGQFARVQVTGPDTRTCSPVSASGDLASTVMWGLAYLEPFAAARQIPEGGAQFADTVSSITSRALGAVAKVARHQRVAVLRGRIEGWTDQLDDGYYTPGMYLTINPATARLKAATGSDVRYARIEDTQFAVNVSSQNNGVEVQLALPNGLL